MKIILADEEVEELIEIIKCDNDVEGTELSTGLEVSLQTFSYGKELTLTHKRSEECNDFSTAEIEVKIVENNGSLSEWLNTVTADTCTHINLYLEDCTEFKSNTKLLKVFEDDL